MLKILYVASEAVPFVKTGGLADVAGSLPKALREKGVDIRVVMPKYGNIPAEYRNNMEHLYDDEFHIAWRTKFLGIDKMERDGVTYYFIDNEEYFAREGFYGYGDDAERFAFFSRAVLELLVRVDFWPDIIHANDWHAALVSVYLKLEHNLDPRYRDIKTIFTIHNLKYQGVFPKNVMEDVLGIDWQYFNNGDLEYYDAVNFMKGAIVYSDYITTVSRTYAEEIQYEYYGEGLDGLLRTRADSLFGIVNGIDTAKYDPRTDKYIYENYDETDLYKKTNNAEHLQKELGLPVDRNIPIVGMVTRLVEAKGLDLVERIMDELLEHEEMQFVLLGVGDRHYEDWFRGLAWRFPTKASINISFSDELAQKIYAASAFFLMPSMYEPCGIGQMIAMRYGARPIVRATGGLRDTVQPYDKKTGKGTGFVFDNYNAHELLYTIKHALGLYEIDHRVKSFENAMKADFSWSHSAAEYVKLYEKLLGK